MSDFTNNYANIVLNGVFRDGYTEAPSAVYIAYAVSASTECTDANYARQAAGLSAATGRTVVNASAISFPAIAATHDVVGCCAYTAATAGVQMTVWTAPIGGTVSLNPTQQFRIPAGDYSLDL